MVSISLLLFYGIGIARKQSNDECVMMTSFSKPNSHSVDLRGVKKVLKNVASDNYYVCDSGPFSWHIMSDDMDFLYVLICKREYPQRCAHMCLHELQPVFRAKTGQKSLTSKEDGLNYVFKSQLNKFFDKYDDVAAVDSLALTMKKVDGAKLGENRTYHNAFDRNFTSVIIISLPSHAAEH